jgi:GNAT superfamily N-acetyltransferase
VLNAQVAIRQAQESDRAQVGRLIAETGHDSELGGDYYVASLEDRIVGAVTLTQLGEEEWWLDGLRVLPEFQRRGIGRALLQHAVQHAVQRAQAQGGVLRLAADPRQPIMRRLAAQAQFALVGSYLAYQTDGLPGYRPEFSLAQNIGAVRAFLDGSAYFTRAERSVEDGGIWYRLTDARLQEFAAQARVYLWHGYRHDPNMLDGVIIFAANAAPPLLRLAYLDAAVGTLADLCRAVRRLAARQGYQRIQHRFLARPERLVAIEQAGWRPPGTDGEDRDLFSRPLDIPQNRLIDP